MSLDPEAHQVAPARWFDDLALGEIFRLPSRTLGDGNFTAFQTVSLDNHPIHYDVAYCARRRNLGPSRARASGAELHCGRRGPAPHQIGDALLGFIEVNAKFLKGVFPADALYPALEIVELTPQRTTGICAMRATVHNQHGELVLDGMHRYLIRRRL